MNDGMRIVLGAMKRTSAKVAVGIGHTGRCSAYCMRGGELWIRWKSIYELGFSVGLVYLLG